MREQRQQQQQLRQLINYRINNSNSDSQQQPEQKIHSIESIINGLKPFVNIAYRSCGLIKQSRFALPS